MSIVVTVEIGSERRAYTADDLPLSVGGDACHLALPGLPDDGPVAYLGHDRGELFIQPSEERAAAALMPGLLCIIRAIAGCSCKA